jgi:hypothetical protein
MLVMVADNSRDKNIIDAFGRGADRRCASYETFSTTAAPLGTNSSINPCASCPSACATGPMGSIQRELGSMPFSCAMACRRGGKLFKILDRSFGLGMMAWPGGKFAVTYGVQLPAHRLGSDVDAEHLKDPLAQIDEPPPWTAGIGPLSIIRVSAVRCSGIERAGNLRYRESPGVPSQIATLSADQAPTAIGCPHMTTPLDVSNSAQSSSWNGRSFTLGHR